MKREELIKKKKTVLEKFYGGKRQKGFHDFNIDNGICRHCGTFFGDEIDKKTRKVKPFGQICKIITPDEVAEFRIPEDY